MTTILAVLFVVTLIALFTQSRMHADERAFWSASAAEHERETRALLDEIDLLRDTIKVERMARELLAQGHAQAIEQARKLDARPRPMPQR